MSSKKPSVFGGGGGGAFYIGSGKSFLGQLI